MQEGNLGLDLKVTLYCYFEPSEERYDLENMARRSW